MARIRSIKPELRTSEVVAEWPRDVRYAWVLLWGYLDDHGRGVDNPRLIASDLFPLDDDITAEVMDAWLWLMASPGDHRPDAPLCRYEVDGRRFCHATNWQEHQRPSHPAKSRSPECPIHENGTRGSRVAPEILWRTSGGSREDLARIEKPQVSPTMESLARISGASPEILVPEQGAGSREQGEGSVTTSPGREDLASLPEDDATPPAVPDTRPAPSIDQPRTEAPAAPVIENAMPPARCRNHLELENPPPCGRCAGARRAQEAWIADRDAKVAAARAQAQAELAAEKAAERAAIDRCTRCDDRGVTDTGVRCTHDARVEVTPGRAAFLAEREKLRQRAAAKAKTEAATGDQLRKLAIAFGEHGTTDRDARLAWCSANIGREITSTTQLTKAEASSLIDVVERDEAPVDLRPDSAPAATTADEPAAYSPEALYDDAEAMEAAVLAAREQADDEDLPPNVTDDDYDADDDPPPGEPDDAVDDEYRADQATWDEPDDDQPAAVYSYAGGIDEPPF